MLNFKKFQTEAYNIPIKDESDIDSLETKQDKDSLKKLVKYLNSLGLDDIPIAGGGGSNSNKIKIRSAQSKEPEIKQWIKDNTPELTGISYGQGSLGKDGVKINENTQEMMVAALVLNKVKSGSISESDAVNMIEDAKKVFNKIDGADARPELLEQFNGNFNDLATAISSSVAILKVAPNPVKVYWTGKGWTGEIAKYNPPVGGVKDYNSSDIVVKNSDGIFHGFSLKKKGASGDVDPTLINKPITGKVGLLKDIMGSKDVELVEKSKQLFFDYVIFKHYKQNPKRIDPKTKSKMIGEITQKQMGIYLKDRKNTFFRRVFQILSKNSEEFTKSFIELLFRTKMKNIEDSGEFKFYLLTGIGKFVKGNVNVENAELKDTPQVISTLTRIFNSDLVMKPTPGKKQAWEKDAGAAKVFFSIFSDNAQIINLEIRYKGSYTANPQFQAVATPNFKKIFKENLQTFKKLIEAPRIPRKKGQPAGSKKHSDLYTDENPKGTIHGLGFKDVETAEKSVKKIENSGKTHAHKIQAAIAMEQRARVMGKTAEANVYRKYIEKMKKITKQRQQKEEVSRKDVNDLEKFADRILKKYGVDIEFTKHFVDRINDPRNSPEIKVSELQRFFKKIQKNKAKNIINNPDTQAVLKDISTNLNLPVVIKTKGDEIEVTNKTIMRKQNFKTPNKVIKYESFRTFSEATESVVFTFGRFNPPTTGHEKLLDKVKKIAGGDDYYIFPSHSQNPKKDPLPFAKKVAYMRDMFPKHKRNIIANNKLKTVLDIAVYFHQQGYVELNMVVGSDRVAEFKKLLTTYNGQEKRHGFYDFDTIQIFSAGERDPDAEGVTGMSASKMRLAASQNNFKDFLKGLPSGYKNGEKLFKDVRKNMGLKESSKYSDEEVERDLYVKGVIYQIGDLVENKEDGTSGEIVRRGTNYVQYTDGENFYKAFLHSIQEKIRRVKQDPDIKDSPGTEPAKYYAKDAKGKDMSKSTKQARDRHFTKGAKMDDDNPDAYKPAPGDKGAKTKPSKYTKKFKQMYGERRIDPADIDTSATDDDIAAADKNIMMQLRKSVSLRGNFPVQFMDKKKVKVSSKIAQAVQTKFDSMKKASDKEKFQSKISKSYKDLLKALKEQLEEQSKGLYYNINKKRKEGRPMRKKGEKGAPRPGDFERAAKTAKQEDNIQELPYYRKIRDKIHQMVHPKGYEKITKMYLDLRKKGKTATQAIGEIGRIVRGVEGRDVAYYINSLVDKGKLPKDLAANIDFEIDEGYMLDEKIAGLVKKSEKSKVPYGILKKVYDRGMAAWRTGHRPGTTPQQWAFARVNSFLTGGGARKSDADLWSKASAAKKRKKESYEIGVDYAKHTFSTTPGQDYNQTFKSKTANKQNITDWFERETTRKEYQDRYKSNWEEKLKETYDRMLEKVCCDDCEDKYIENNSLDEAEYEGRKVKLNDPFRLPSGSSKKFGVYVKNEKGNIIKVTFGDPNMEIKRDDPGRLKSFRARHNCDNPGPKTKARYWSCFQWRKGAKVDN